MEELKEITQIMLFVLGLVLSGLFGFFIRSENTVLISDKLISCEQKGGKYSYWWNDLSDKYEETCRVTKKDITNF